MGKQINLDTKINRDEKQVYLNAKLTKIGTIKIYGDLAYKKPTSLPKLFSI